MNRWLRCIWQNHFSTDTVRSNSKANGYVLLFIWISDDLISYKQLTWFTDRTFVLPWIKVFLLASRAVFKGCSSFLPSFWICRRVSDNLNRFELEKSTVRFRCTSSTSMQVKLLYPSLYFYHLHLKEFKSMQIYRFHVYLNQRED